MTDESGPAARWQQAVISRIERRTPRVVSVFLSAPRAPHVPGQYVDVRLTAEDGYQAQRSYSIASTPGAPLVELAIERMAEGEVSAYFHDVARAGDAIEARGPIGGSFNWRAADGGPLLLVAGGSGIAPLMSMVRHRATTAPGVPALLAYSARGWDEIIFRDELLALAAADPRLALVLATTRGDHSPRPGDLHRRLDRAAFRELLARWGHAPRLAYVCGSTPFVEAATMALVEEGIEPASIRAERFGGSV